MFELDNAQKQIQKAAWEFAKGEFDKNLILELEKKSTFPESIWKKATQLGFIGLHFDEACSGGGMGVLEHLLAAEAFCRKDSSCGMALVQSGFASELILRFGNEEQKDRYLSLVAQGLGRSGGAFFEPGLGYEVSQTKTLAKTENEEWVINGAKTRVVNGMDAAFYLVLCRSVSHVDPEKGLAVILVEKDTPGLRAIDSGRKLGDTMTSMADLVFEDVRVPMENLVGINGKGLAQVNRFLEEAQILNAGMALGLARGALDRALAYAKQREQFGRKIALFEVIGDKIAKMALKIELARGIAYGAAHAFDKKYSAKNSAKSGKKKALPSALACMAMEYACQAAEEIADDAIQIHGGYGYMHEAEIEHFYRDAKYLRLHYSNPGSRNKAIASSVIVKVK